MSSNPPSAPLIHDLVDANRILFSRGIVDVFGHVSARHDGDPNRFLLSRCVAAGDVTMADILEYAVDNGEPIADDPPQQYLERYVHSEIYRARPDVMAVVHSHSTVVLPFTMVPGARLRPICHMAGFLGAAPPLFDIRDYAGDASDLMIRDRGLGEALARSLGNERDTCQGTLHRRWQNHLKHESAVPGANARSCRLTSALSRFDRKANR